MTTEPKFIEVSAEVRYWEDATINGVADTNGTLTPFKKGNLWEPVIRLIDGQFMDWPEGTTANIHFKVCDAGEYWLQDDQHKRVAKWSGSYVPNSFLCHGDNGYGDYIILKVGPDGKVIGWRPPAVVMADDEDKDESGWEALT